MKKFIEKVPRIHFPKEYIQNLSISVPIMIEKEMEKMKMRTSDIFFGLFSKEDMSPYDGDQIIHYFGQNYDEIT